MIPPLFSWDGGRLFRDRCEKSGEYCKGNRLAESRNIFQVVGMHMCRFLGRLILVFFVLPSPVGALPAPEQDCRNVFFIDRDCDGYGVGSEAGPDADDQDPTVNTARSVNKKYGGVKNFIASLGYHPENIYLVGRPGETSTADADDSLPVFNNWQMVMERVRPGDIVLFKGGEYGITQEEFDRFHIVVHDLHGTPEKPVVIMAFPGDKVVLYGRENAIEIKRSSHLVIDGFICDSKQQEGKAGLQLHFSNNIIIKNLETRNQRWGIHGSEDWRNILLENIVTHDNPGEHGIYIGSRDYPNSSITIRNTISFRNGRHGFQHNGRIEKLIIENSLFHSNQLGGLSLINGITGAVIRNNIIFNNNKQGIILYSYAQKNHNIHPFANDNNLFEHNIVWVGSESNGTGGQSPEFYPAVLLNDTSEESLVMHNNRFEENVLVTFQGPVFEFRQLRHLPRTLIQRNIFFRSVATTQSATGQGESPGEEDQSQGRNKAGGLAAGWQLASRIGGKLEQLVSRFQPQPAMASEETDGSHTTRKGNSYQWQLVDLEKKHSQITGNLQTDPEFFDVQPQYSRNPERFDFRMPAGSPAAAAGLLKKVRPDDDAGGEITGDTRSDLPRVQGVRILRIDEN